MTGRKPITQCTDGRDTGYLQVLIPPEKCGAVVYDHWDKYDYPPCLGVVKNSELLEKR